MKKIFTLIAVAMMTVGGAMAQTISWTETAAKGTLNGHVFKNGDVTLTVTDTDGKVEVDANSQYFGSAESYKNFTYRLKTGGKSGNKNTLTLSVPAKGVVKIYARSGSSSDLTRTVVLTQNSKEILNQIVKDNDAVKVSIEGSEKAVFPVYNCNVETGTINITYPINAINFYGIEFIKDDTGISDIIVADDANAPAYNLAGQRVNANAKGLVIKNGKKYVNK